MKLYFTIHDLELTYSLMIIVLKTSDAWVLFHKQNFHTTLPIRLKETPVKEAGKM